MATGIYDAAVYGNRAEVERIIGKHPEAVNEADEYGYTPLHGLAEEEHLEIAQYRSIEARASTPLQSTALRRCTLPPRRRWRRCFSGMVRISRHDPVKEIRRCSFSPVSPIASLRSRSFSRLVPT